MKVLVEVPTKEGTGSVARATLNAPKALNSLDMEMIESLTEHLTQWESDKSIDAVFIDASGDKAFCAGGDIVALYNGIQEKDDTPQTFFAKEYKLDYLIHRYKKPIVIWGHGIVMGGGMGIMQGGHVRIVTEKTMMAMPEITIGLYPDVGASYFLQNCPSKTGLFLGLTGVRINGNEALWLDLADQLIDHSQKDKFLEDLCKLSFSKDYESDKKLIKELAEKSSEGNSEPLLENTIKEEIAFVEEIAACKSPQELDKKMRSFQSLNKWCERAVKNFLKGSPSSIGIIFEQFRRAEKLSLKEAFQMEWKVSVQCCRHPDLPEGIRALLIDKDNKPTWTPGTIAGLTSDWILRHFEMPEGIETHPLDDL